MNNPELNSQGILHVIGIETCEIRPEWNIHLWRQCYYHYKDTEHDVRGPRLGQSESTVQITKGKNLKISCTAVYPEASYVDTFWLFNGSRKQTNFKYEIKDARFRKRTEGTIKSTNISFTIYNAVLSDSGQYCPLNISRG